MYNFIVVLKLLMFITMFGGAFETYTQSVIIMKLYAFSCYIVCIANNMLFRERLIVKVITVNLSQKKQGKSSCIKINLNKI